MGKPIGIGRVLANLPLFQQLQEREIASLAAETREIGLNKGRILFQNATFPSFR